MQKKRLLGLFATIVFGSFSLGASVHESNSERSSIAQFFSDDSARAVSGIQEDNMSMPIAFGQTAGDGFGNFYLGASVANKADSAVIRTSVVKDSNGVSSISITPLAGLVYDASGATVDSPLKNKIIAHMKLVGPSNNQLLAVVNDAELNVHLMTSVRDGLRMVNSVTLKDTNQQDIDATPLAVEGTDVQNLSGRSFFSVVAPNSTLSVGSDPGVALLNSSLTQIAPQVAGAVQAQPIVTDAASDLVDINGVNAVNGLAFYANGTSDPITKALLSNPTAYDLHWDEKLQRLYVAVDNVTRDDNAKDGGIMSILVGGFDENNNFFLRPIVPNPQAGMFASLGSFNYQIGFYAPAADTDAYVVSARLVRTMHTSTGKDYIIVNGGFSLDASLVADNVVSLPVLPVGDANAGQLARVNGADDYTVAGIDPMTSMVEDLALNTVPLVVGNSIYSGPVNDMQIVGDSVFIASIYGIFKSTALFDDNGNIRRWTRWQRVASTQIGVMYIGAFGFDINSANGNFQYLTSADGDYMNPATTIKGTVWGASSSVTDGMSRQLTDVVNSICTDGVYQIFNFAQSTPGFNQITGAFSMLVAVGADKVALIQAGTNDVFTIIPTTEFMLGTNVFSFNDPALQAIAPIVTAELSRVVDNNYSGYVYVGGYNGIARLQNGSGDGFNNNGSFKEFDPMGFPGNGFAFEELGNFQNVVAIASAGDGFIDVLTRDAYYYKLDFDLAGGTVVTDLPYGVDLVVTPALRIIATTQGLFTTTDGVNFTQISQVQGLPIKLIYLSETEGVPSSQGNLYVLSVDRDDDSGILQLFSVNGASMTLLNESVINLHAFRESFFTDGAFFFNQQQRDVNQKDLIRFGTRDQASASLTSLLPIDSSTNTHIGWPVRDTASGCFVLPGDFGIFVNE
ncbi:hypothetical protein IPF37_01750 [bacterium]|nr:MAG: hypothetical protein IPF37_01750 [bacterium]